MSGKKEPEKIRIAVFLPTSIQMGGGVERWALNMLGSMDRSRFSLTLIETAFLDRKRFDSNRVERALEGVSRMKIVSPDSRFRYLRLSRPGSAFLSLFHWIIIALYRARNRELLDKIEENNDIIYLARNSYSGLFTGKKALLIGSCHTDFPYDSPYNIFRAKLVSTGFLLRKMDAFHMFQGRDKVSGILAKKRYVFNVPNPVNIPIGQCTKTGPARFVYLGRLEAIKGVDILMDAWNLFRKDGCTLTIIGGGSMEKTIGESHMENMEIRGLLSDDALFRCLCESDVFVYPTRWDSLPTTVLESLCSGNFVVTTKFLENTFLREKADGFIDFRNLAKEDFLSAMEYCRDNISDIRGISGKISARSNERYGIGNVVHMFTEEMVKLAGNMDSS